MTESADEANLAPPVRRRKRWVWLVLSVVVACVASWLYVSNRRLRGRPRLESSLASVGINQTPHEIGAMGWNRFRGPNGSGISSDTEVPLQWGDDKNLAWKTAIPGDGSSSPALTERLVFVTSYTRNDTGSREVNDLTRHVHCVDQDTGDLRWTKSFQARLPESEYIGRGVPEHGYATSTPVTDGERVFVFFGKSGVYCLDLEGEELWHADVGDGLNRMGWGSCSSPILCGDLLIVNAGEEAGTLLALDKNTGAEVWRSDAPRLPFSFGTPALVDVGDRIEIVVGAVGEVWGINPASGKLLWYATVSIDGNCSPSVVVSGRLVYVFGGFSKRGGICVEAGGRGDVTGSMVRWTTKHRPYIPTPIILDQKVYWIGSGGKFFCLDASNGDLLSRERLPKKASGSGIYASAISIGGKLFVQTRRDGVVVLDGQPKMKVLHQNRFADESRSNATPAVANGRLFLRSDDYLYCVAKPTLANP